MARSYSKNLAGSTYGRWLGFVSKSKELQKDHKLATEPLPTTAEAPRWHDLKREKIKAPDGEEYVVYYAEQTQEEFEKAEDAKRKKGWEEENEIAENWRKAHNDGKFSFNLTGAMMSPTLSSLATKPKLLGLDHDKNRWYIKYGAPRGYWSNAVQALFIEKIRPRGRKGEEAYLEAFLNDPTILSQHEYATGGEKIPAAPPPTDIMNQIEQYKPLDFKYLTWHWSTSSMDPKVGPLNRWASDGASREPSLEEKAKSYKEPLIIDWGNPNLEDVKKVVKARGLEGKVDEVKFDVPARYSLFDVKGKEP